MKTRWWLECCAIVSIVFCAGSARAGVAVTNYNWLQLKPGKVTAFVGGASMNYLQPTKHGDVHAIRWSYRAWIPETNVNNNATADYWAGLEFDQARQVTNVIADIWASHETCGVSRFYIEGYPVTGPQANTWVEIGTNDFGSMQTGQELIRVTVPVTAGDYLRIRVRFKAGDYQKSTAYAGPGLWTIEPFGNGTLADGDVNWANAPSFGTTRANNGLDYNGTGYGDGFFYDYDNGTRTGDNGDWESGDYVQIDLGQPRRIGLAVIVPQSSYVPSTFTVQYSTDGISYQAVTNAGPVITYGRFVLDDKIGGLEMSFDPITARYWRITDLKAAITYTIFNEVLLYDRPTPEKQVDVLDYSWLQLKPTNVTASVGSTGTSGPGVTQFGAIDNFRWSLRAWLPHKDLTAGGTSDYWGMLEFDEDRNVNRVSVDIWANSTTCGVRRFYVEGYPTTGPNANTWVEIAKRDFGSMQTAQDRINVVLYVATTDAYRKLRVRFAAGDYQGDATYGGPGLWTIEAWGRGTLAAWDVNWANKNSFTTVPSVNGLDYAGTGYNSGTFYDSPDVGRCGDVGAWESGDYAQLDLGRAREIHRAVLAWNSQWFSQTFAAKYSTDGINFTSVANPGAVIHYGANDDTYGRGAAELTFDPVTARYWRIVDLSGGPKAHMIFDQALLYGKPPPHGTAIILR